MALDAANDYLYIADQDNNRVLAYNNPLQYQPPVSPTPSSPIADFVWGQNGSFTTKVTGTTANNLAISSGVALDAAGTLYVADQINNRVLVYGSPLATPTPTATISPTATMTVTTTPSPTVTTTPSPTVTTTPSPTVTTTPSPTATPTCLAPSGQTELAVDPASYDFGNSTVNTTVSETFTVRVTGPPTGGAILDSFSVNNLSWSGITAPFALDQATTCPMGGTCLQKGTTCTIVVDFTPTAVTPNGESDQGQLIVKSKNANSLIPSGGVVSLMGKGK